MNQPEMDLLRFARPIQDFILSEVGCHGNKTLPLKSKHPDSQTTVTWAQLSNERKAMMKSNDALMMHW